MNVTNERNILYRGSNCHQRCHRISVLQIESQDKRDPESTRVAIFCHLPIWTSATAWNYHENLQDFKLFESAWECMRVCGQMRASVESLLYCLREHERHGKWACTCIRDWGQTRTKVDVKSVKRELSSTKMKCLSRLARGLSLTRYKKAKEKRIGTV